MSLDSISQARLQSVLPELADKIAQMATILEDEFAFRVTQALRTWDEQATLYAQGRTAPGKVVTNAKPGYSYHNFGMAVDLVPMIDLTPDWNTSHPVWQRLIQVGESVGLVSGSRWRTFPDWPHFQLTGSLPESPDDAVRNAYVSGGMNGVWSLAGFFDGTTGASGTGGGNAVA